MSSIFLWISRLTRLFYPVTLLLFIIINLKWGPRISHYSIEHLCLCLFILSPQLSAEQPSRRTYQHIPVIGTAVVESKERTDSAQYPKARGRIRSATLFLWEAQQKCCLCHQCETFNKTDTRAFLGTTALQAKLLRLSAHPYCEKSNKICTETGTSR